VCKRQTEAPVNGGSNYNCPKVDVAASPVGNNRVNIWLYAGKSEYPTLRGGAMITESPRENVLGADNQQERLVRLGWVVGFVDGEGCFSIGFIRQGRNGCKTGYQVTHEFVVTQGAKSISCLHELQQFFGVGQVLVNNRHDNHREHLYRYVVRKRRDLLEVVIPFFQRNPLHSSKQQDFEKFARCMELIKSDYHLTHEGLIEIAEIAQTMNRQKPRTELIRILRDHTPDIRDIG
jgi:LAGLIDADG endonuclease